MSKYSLYPDKFAELVRTHPKKPGEPFSFKGREFLRQVYREFSPDVKEKTLIYFGSRKIEKTEFILNLILYVMTTGFVPWNVLYTIARRKQVRVFSEKRLVPAINTSIGGCLREKYVSNRPGIHDKKFITNLPGVFNHLSLESSWNLAESMLGEESQMVISDETQSQTSGFFAMLNEMMTQSEWKWFVLTGTARDASSELATLWKQTTQNLWVVKCKHCGEEQIFKRRNDDKTITYKAMGMQNIFREVICECGETHLKQGWGSNEFINCDCGAVHTIDHYDRVYKGCAFCKEPIDVTKGKWRAFNPKGMYIGYHANQIMHPSIPASKIYNKYISPGYPRIQFMNEVLGEFFGGEGGAVQIEDVLACRRENYEYVNKSEGENNLMGIDTGKPNYVTIVDGNNDRILFQDAVEFKNTEDRKNYFIDKFDKFNIRQCVVDWGYTGVELAKDLQQEFGDRVKTCRYTTRPGDWYQYKERDALGNRIYKIEADKVTACTEVIHKFADRGYKIPFGNRSQDKAETTFDHYVNVVWEKPDEILKPMVGTPSTKLGNAGPDHYFHTLVYIELCKIVKKAKVKLAVIGSKINKVVTGRKKKSVELSKYFNGIVNRN
jgi:hypothetical protein